MVDRPVPERRHDAEYSLEQVHRLASFGQVDLRGIKIRQDLVDLGYELDDLCQCLAELERHHFRHSERYENFTRWHDVYKKRHTGPDGQTRNLYIKLRLSRDCITIEMCSFHD